jgi:hypothetical protein
VTAIRSEPDCGVIARWAEQLTVTRCGECDEHLPADLTHCPRCGQKAVGDPVGMLATVIETIGGRRRLVVSRREPAGAWTPCRVLVASEEAVRMLRRSAAGRARYWSEQTSKGALG